jgi:chemotaxis protein CheZ
MTAPQPPALSDADFDAILSAVMETNRGRWFLAEYARRNRYADTETLLGAIHRLENAMRREKAEAPPSGRVRDGLADMAEAIARTKQEIAALRPDSKTGAIEDTTEELDAIVSATEKATSDILAAAEQIQETAWILREHGAATEACDRLDQFATDIYTACSFQDLTGQRIRKVINVLRYLEARVIAMIQSWGSELPSVRTELRRSDGLLNGPAKPGEGLDQAGIDLMMEPSARAGAGDDQPTEIASAPRAARAPEAAPLVVEPICDDAEEQLVVSEKATDPRPILLPSLAGMTYEQRVALFT